jgi:hypothetical protein
METKQLIAILGMLAFLGTFALLAGSAIAIVCLKLVGEERLTRWSSAGSAWLFGGCGLTRKLLLAALLLLVGYATVLLSASAASREWALGSGEEKYFCEIDCHIAYSVAGVEKTDAIGTAPSRKASVGTFYIVNVRTRFDEHTISPRRGDSPLEPSPRLITLVDDRGREYSVSQEGQQTLETSIDGRWKPLDTPLRPGESYITPLVFDLPPDARGLKLLIASPTQPGWLGRVLIGDEGSILHKKVYLRLESQTG